MQTLENWIDLLKQSDDFTLIVVAVLFALLLMLLLWLFAFSKNVRLSAKYKRTEENFQKAFIQKQNLENRLETLQEFFNTQERELLNLKQEHQQASEEKARLEEKLNIQDQQSEIQKQFTEENKKQMEDHFSVLAQKIFENKSQQVESQQKNNLESSLKPFQEQLNSFQKKVEELYDRDLRDRMSLSSEIDSLKKLNLKISDDALRLTQALRGNNKTQGNWGEMILEQVLQDSGLRKGYEYEVQVSHKNEAGKRVVPDVIVHLPAGKDIVIDSKVSLISYERYATAENEETRKEAIKDFLKSMSAHVNGLNSKAYEKMQGVRSLDFVFLFVPIEAAFLLALEHDTEIFRTAFNKQVVLVSPTTLFACLRTVEHLWRYERQNQHAEEIARQAAGLHDKLVGFSDNLVNVGNSLEKALGVHEQAVRQFSQGKGNVLDRVKKLSALGAPVKKQFDKSLVKLSEIDESSPDQTLEQLTADEQAVHQDTVQEFAQQDRELNEVLEQEIVQENLEAHENIETLDDLVEEPEVNDEELEEVLEELQELADDEQDSVLASEEKMPESLLKEDDDLELDQDIEEQQDEELDDLAEVREKRENQA